MNIGERILKLRKESHLSQEEVANKLNVSRQTISKWETGESNPDFDKIVPLCELFNVSTDELIKGTKEEKGIIDDNKEYKKKTAQVLTISIFMYFLAVIWIIFAESLSLLNEEIMVCVFLLICALATCLIIYHFVANSKSEKEQIKEKKYNSKIKRIDSIISLVFTIIYLLVSFLTMAWGITWILWIVYAIVIEIVHLIMGVEDDIDE